MERKMRKIERQLTADETREILAAGEYGILSTIGADGSPYGVPVSYCLINDAVYFHCAVEGHKLENIAADSRVSFCVVGRTELLPEKFSTRYESVIVSGKATEVFNGEKQLAMEGLQQKYSAEFRAEGLAYIEKAWQKTKVFKITMEQMSGKARR